MDKQTAVKEILQNCTHASCAEEGYAFASSNVALCKYWGKRDEELNLPVTSSLSLTLNGKGAFTRVKRIAKADRYIVNGHPIPLNSKFALRLKNFLDLFRDNTKVHYQVETELNIPIASGLASSACGFAALVQALNNLYDWRLDKQKLSILARLGSGSACRSLWSGFVEWQAGENPNGMDSFGVELPYCWPDLRVGLLILSDQEKPISSREAMRHTMQTSPLYSVWPDEITRDLQDLKMAIEAEDFELFGRIAEANSLFMHEMMLAANPPINYSLPETYAAMHQVYEMREMGAPVFFTQDAGPNLQLLFLAKDSYLIQDMFPDVEIIAPFVSEGLEQVVLVDENDLPIGVAEMEAHVSGKLHRGFSIFILRQKAGTIEVLLQKRQKDKYHSGGLWSNTCCGHPRRGEDIVLAAERRLKEEMGFGAELKPLGSFHYEIPVGNGLAENEIDHILVGVIDIENPPLNKKEAEDSKWVSLDTLKKDLTLHPGKYTPWLPEAYERLLNCIFSDDMLSLAKMNFQVQQV